MSVPGASPDAIELDLVYEGIDAATLRLRRTTVHGPDAASIAAKLRKPSFGGDAERIALRKTLAAAGAAGRIGNVALAFVDAEPAEPPEVLRRLASTGDGLPTAQGATGIRTPSC